MQKNPSSSHCMGGADRGSIAAALYLAAIAQKGEKAEERHISLRHGHISLPWFKSYAIDQSWEILKPWLGYFDS
ncbi:MAG: protein tyrosine/serine phosphatase [Desulfobulbus sp.]|jgi:protein tyrosine/serine phosphatase